MGHWLYVYIILVSPSLSNQFYFYPSADTLLRMSPEAIRRKIGDLPQDNPAQCEGLIRKLHKHITSLKDHDEKENLLEELEAVASRGLQEDLKNMLEKNGLHLEGLRLVTKYLTNTRELAEYFYSNSEEDIEKESLTIIYRRLRRRLEVLGGLSASGIDVTKEWVKRLCGRAPSLQELSRLPSSDLKDFCQGANEGEMDQVHKLIETARSHQKQLSNNPQDERLVQNNKATEVQLKEAKGLMIEAKKMATDGSETANKTVNDKIEEIRRKLELPPDWFKQNKVQPDQMFQQLDQIIQQYNEVVESSESYKSAVGVIINASGGKALFGFFHSEYEGPKPAGRPLILPPTDVTLTSPSLSRDMNFMKFSAQGAAADYIRTVESLNTNIGLALAGFEGLMFGEAQGAGGYARQKQFHGSQREFSTSASVLHYTRTPTKSFLLERNQIKICESAKEMARSIARGAEMNRIESQEIARLFFQRYGSHFPAGVQTLGGVFFSIAEAESKGATETFELIEAATNHLQVQMSSGFFSGFGGNGGSAAFEHTGSEGSNKGKHTESRHQVFTYYTRSIGPTATNPNTFQKLLSFHSTWALIDRGPIEGYIPVWELLRDLGSEYHTAANVLEETWKGDENKRKHRKMEDCMAGPTLLWIDLSTKDEPPGCPKPSSQTQLIYRKPSL